jgi:hypothetical protein
LIEKTQLRLPKLDLKTVENAKSVLNAQLLKENAKRLMEKLKEVRISHPYNCKLSIQKNHKTYFRKLSDLKLEISELTIIPLQNS